MRSKRSRLALVGALTLALSVTVGLTAGGAVAAKKKKQKSARANVTKQVNAPIPDAAGAPTFTDGVLKSTIGLTAKKFSRAQSKQVRDVNVQINVAHADVSDLSFFLRAPGGRTVPLVCAFDLTGTSIAGLVLDDESPNTVFGFGPPAVPSEDQLGPPYTGSAQPCNYLSHLFSTPVRGQWTLIVRDNSNTSTGTLQSWRLNVVSGPKFLSKAGATK